ncbi:hypothetical protein A2X44_04860 [candidate division CPR3 bacterium GWF2_35_18]|uniref:2-oxoacid oxidoreductase, gamma-alpha subunit n=1 Tax=candidate division CPR3 bacterium GW2011_GWF2_35_18 TaxID=1618350 RepID=A0A0G0E3C5_UNCC3|nr:MAG: 2-oxoacid oxidoreductase, gamma-alpha subunit [candidate division CPR3 bacterium GW2011_GWF2_35_18]OGB63664.1 MAG: hypothetical protein A2X44_04860 [candidate division CPR3 bacterium GWF2_35_18]OGB65015.1 MAG: hypothetical protein A2250_01180 [candidate division CPR3 bacterium RIFOXYA2_FULL_35_13]OGB79555.1 MAG: hypothetical protein A2296_04520 [candidate division CPR3 bacterium RIFOXYB2_FULL_35_8]
MSKIDFTWKIGGEAGFGIASAGLIFAKTLNRLNYYVYGYLEYPSLIRGGHNVYEVHVSGEPVYSQERQVDLLVCLNTETFNLHKNELKKDAIIIYDPLKTQVEESANYKLYAVEVSKIVKELGGLPVMENNLFVGISLALLQADKEAIFAVVSDIFTDKGEAVISLNEKIIEAGYDFVTAHPFSFSQKIEKLGEKNSYVMTGNEAISLGAIAADCRLYASYPMTPASSILHILAGYSNTSKMVVKHVGDEIEAINLLVGASFSGVRCMTGTSGGGFALMNEGFGLAGVTESAMVLVISQRPGPATGLPTWTGQADLQFVIHAAQDEFPRIVLAPGDAEEAYNLTQEAFNLADKYQTPVFVLSDKYLSEGLYYLQKENLQKFPINRGKLIPNEEIKNQTNFLRYAVTKDGISPRSVAGQENGEYLANSYEHDERGFATEDAIVVKNQKDKRQQKSLNYLDNDFVGPSFYGNKEAELTIISWGSTKAPVLEAMKNLGDKVNFMHFHHVYPLNSQLLSKILSQTKKSLLLEGNGTGQFGLLLREQTGWQSTHLMLKYDGRPFYPEEIQAKIKEILGN